MEKLSKEEWDRFNSARENLFDLKSQIADVTINQEQLKARKSQLLANFDIAHSELMKEQNAIHEKFGECRVDFVTGEIHVNS